MAGGPVKWRAVAWLRDFGMQEPRYRLGSVRACEDVWARNGHPDGGDPRPAWSGHGPAQSSSSPQTTCSGCVLGTAYLARPQRRRSWASVQRRETRGSKKRSSARTNLGVSILAVPAADDLLGLGAVLVPAGSALIPDRRRQAVLHVLAALNPVGGAETSVDSRPPSP